MRICTIFFIMLIIIISTACNLNASDFSTIELLVGRNWNDVIKLRPNAKILSLGPDEIDTKPNIDSPGGGLIEKVYENNMYYTVMYIFYDGVLESINIVGTIDEDERSIIIKKYLQKYGENNVIDASKTEKNSGILKWNENSRHIRLIMPMAKSDNKQKFAIQFFSEKGYTNLEHLESPILPNENEPAQLQQFKDEIKKVKALLIQQEK